MNIAYVAIEHTQEQPTVVAIFWNQQAANNFAKDENDAVQAEIVEIEPVALIDNYGFPCMLKDIYIIAPWAA